MTKTPTLVVVSGPSGTGKTTLAHKLARAIGCPAICRDEIKEGMAHGIEGFTPAVGDPLTRKTFGVFFDVLRVLVENGVTVVAEAAFQDKVWGPSLEPLAELAELRIVQCHADPEVARERVRQHTQERTAHADAALLAALESGSSYYEDFKRVSIHREGAPSKEIDARSVDVDTTNGYNPSLAELVDFAS